MWRQRRGSKYGNSEKEYNGRIYHSQKEAGYARDLDLMLKGKEIKSWKPQHKLSLDVNGYHICNYIADFLVVDKYGEEQIHEVKGFETDVFRMKWKLVEALYSNKYNLILIK